MALNLIFRCPIGELKKMLPHSSRLLIHMAGFNQDTAWAIAMEQVIRHAKNNIHLFQTLPELLYFLSEEYRTYKMNRTRPEEGNNQYYQEQDLHNFGQNRTTVLKTPIESRYLPYLPRVKQLLGENDQHQARLILKGRNIPLTVTQRRDAQYLWVHTSPDVFPFLCTEMNEIYQKIKWLQNQQPNSNILKIALEHIAKLHWLLAQTMPYERGSAGVSDILSKVLLDVLGIRTSSWKTGLAPDLEALTLSCNSFIKRYTHFFDTPPEAEAEPQVLYQMEFPEAEEETSVFSA